MDAMSCAGSYTVHMDVYWCHISMDMRVRITTCIMGVARATLHLSVCVCSCESFTDKWCRSRTSDVVHDKWWLWYLLNYCPVWLHQDVTNWTDDMHLHVRIEYAHVCFNRTPYTYIHVSTRTHTFVPYRTYITLQYVRTHAKAHEYIHTCIHVSDTHAMQAQRSRGSFSTSFRKEA